MTTRLALLGTNLPSVSVRRETSNEVTLDVNYGDDRFIARELKLSVPYVSSGYYVEGRGGVGCELHPAPVASGALRKFLAVFVGTVWTRDKYGENHIVGNSMLRPVLQAECALAEDCHFGVTTLPGDKREKITSDKLDVYSEAVFCLQPWGDTMLRRGFWDALAYSCINVVFATSDGELGSETPHDGRNFAEDIFGESANYTVTVPLRVWRYGRTLEFLRAIPRDRVVELQDAVLVTRTRSTYTLNGTREAGKGKDEDVSLQFGEKVSRLGDLEETGPTVKACHAIGRDPAEIRSRNIKTEDEAYFSIPGARTPPSSSPRASLTTSDASVRSPKRYRSHARIGETTTSRTFAPYRSADRRRCSASVERGYR